MKKQKAFSQKAADFLWLHRRRLGWFTVLFVGLIAIQLSYNWRIGQPRLFGFSTHINQQELLTQANDFRKGNGLSVLTPNQQLAEAAQAKAEDMVKHQDITQIRDKLDKFTEQAHYKSAKIDTTIAFGFTDSSEVITAWAQSKPTATTLNTYKEVGFGIVPTANYYGSETTLVVALYGQPEQQAQTAATSPQKPQEIRGLPLITSGGAPWAIYASLALLATVALGFVMAHLELFRSRKYRSKKDAILYPAFDAMIIVALTCNLIYTAGGFIW